MRNRDWGLREYFCRCARRLMEQEWAAGRQPSLLRLAELTMQHSLPPCYKLDYDNAMSTLNRLDRAGGRLNCQRGQRWQRAMWVELDQRVKQRMTECNGESKGRALQHVLTVCRPLKWHISTATAIRWLTQNIRDQSKSLSHTKN